MLRQKTRRAICPQIWPHPRMGTQHQTLSAGTCSTVSSRSKSSITPDLVRGVSADGTDFPSIFEQMREQADVILIDEAHHSATAA